MGGIFWRWQKLDTGWFIPQLRKEKDHPHHRTKVPDIGEKVKFWEEQDRINQLLIPRIMELHEKVVKMSGYFGTVSESLAQSESRNKAEVKRVRNELWDVLTNIRAGLEAIDREIVQLKGDVTQLDALKTGLQVANASINDLHEANQTLEEQRNGLHAELEILKAAVTARGDQLFDGLRTVKYLAYGAVGLGGVALIVAGLHLI